MKYLDVVVIGPNVKYDPVMVHQRMALSYPAQLAVDLVKAGSMHAWPADTSDGREQKFRMPSVEEVVTRAVATVELVYSEMEKREWVKQAPAFHDLISDRQGAGIK